MYLKLCVRVLRYNRLHSEGPVTKLWRLSSSSNEGHSENETSKEIKRSMDSAESVKSKREAISKQLLEQILSMKVSGSAEDDPDKRLNLAVPQGSSKAKRIKEHQIHDKDNESSDVDQKMLSAVKDVAVSLGGDIQKTESELLQKLKRHDFNAHEKIPSSPLGDLFTGMKVDRSRSRKERVFKSSIDEPQGNFPNRFTKDVEEVARYTRDNKLMKHRVKSRILDRSDVDIFGSVPLNIFSKKTATENAHQLEFPELKTWDALEERELQLLVSHPFANGFEEMIAWTKQGKIWTFPINNEQGMDEEAKVGFHEHVFLDHLISDFPKKGPVRHFMELVLVGLSKNPYLTVQQKKDHIEWFRNYFKEKEDVLKSVGALE